MSGEAVTTVIVPGFYGYLGVDDPGPDSHDLVDQWLAEVEGQPGSHFDVVMPGEGILCRDLPPDSTLSALGTALAADDASEVLFFAHDWRRSLVSSAARLAEEIDEHLSSVESGKVDLVGIGPGGLVIRYMLESGALVHGASRTRRVVLVATPQAGIPMALPVLWRFLQGVADKEALAGVLESFPSMLQLLPPRGTNYLSLADRPAMRVEPFAWPEMLFSSGGNSVSDELMREVIACNESLHGRLRSTFHPSWRRTLVVASSSEATCGALGVRVVDDRLEWELVPAASAGDGLIPIPFALLPPTVRWRMATGRHRQIGAESESIAGIVAFLRGPLT